MKERKRMSSKIILLKAIVIGGTLGLATGPSWSQDDPRGSRPVNPEQSRPGASENVPAARSAAQELSTNDMKLVQQRLREKGYDPGTINGTADETTRAAIRKFQQDQGVPVTGTIDERTANQLGFQYSKNPVNRGAASDQPAPSERPSGR
jgi:peptidoglycan hydrolase-like protein with peptidoglycan-binding domain